LAGRKNILSRQYYVDKRGVYTRILMKPIQNNKKNGSRLKDLMDILPALSRPQIQKLLD